MDPLLLPLWQVSDAAERERLTAELALSAAAPLTRQIMRQRLGFYINADGFDPYHQEAADLYQNILLKVLQTLHDRLKNDTLPELANFRQYVMRIATNACHDHHRAQSPTRTRFKTLLHDLLIHHTSFATWRDESATLCGLTGWRGGSFSVWAQRRLNELAQHPAAGTQLALQPSQLKQENLSQVVGVVLEHSGGPVYLDDLVRALLSLLQPAQSRFEN